MKQLFSLSLLVASALAGSAFASENCKDPQSQSAINTCAKNVYVHEDAQLNMAYRQLVAKLEENHREKLKEIQLAWIKYRDLHCDFYSASYMVGTMYPVVRYSCLSQMTKQRTADLKSMLEDSAK